MKRREKKSDGLRLRGWGKFFHGLFLFITFPIRKPLIFIPILMLGYLAPTFMGAKPTEVHLWYWKKIKSHTQLLGSGISEKAHEILPNVDQFKISIPKLKSLNIEPEKENVMDQIIETPETDNIANTRRQIFEKSKEAPNTIDALKTAQLQEERMRRTQKTPRQNSPYEVQSSSKKLPLVYVNNNEEVKDTAEVLNANELKIDGKTYFLHGIYVDPKTPKGMEAKSFLQSVIAQNIIECLIKAYTYEGVGTIICTVNGENINWMLVNRGYSQNVALEK